MTTLAILNTGNSVDVDIAVIKAADRGDYAIISPAPSQDDDTREAVFQKVVGNAEYPLSVRIGWYKNPKANDGIGSTNVSVKVSSYLQKLDDDNDVLWTKPCSVTLATNMPGLTAVPDTDDVMELVGNAVTWLLPVQSGAIVTDVLEEVKFGVVGNLLAHAISASA